MERSLACMFLYFIMVAQLNSCTSQRQIADSLKIIAAKESTHDD